MKEGKIESRGVQSPKIRYGSPDALDGSVVPREKHRGSYDVSEPLELSGHEAVARYLASPKSLREFKSDTDLGKNFQVTRMTIYRWKQDPDVIQRAHWLSSQHEMAGDLVARREWSRIMEAAAKLAISGDVSAMKFCESRAWRKGTQVEQSLLSTTVSIRELLGPDEDDEKEESYDDEQSKGSDR